MRSYLKASTAALLIVVVQLSLINVTNCQQLFNSNQVKLNRGAISNALNKLESFANELTNESDLTIGDMTAAYLEYQNLHSEYKRQLRETSPLFHLLSDFLLIPMEKYLRLLNENNYSLDFGRKLTLRTEASYKHFRPLYLGQRNPSTDTVLARKTDALISSLMSPLQQQQQVTKKLFYDAMNEYVSFARQLQEIGQQLDIFAYREDVERILNYLNRDTTRVLVDKIFPLVHLADQSEERMQFLRDIYLDELQKLGYVLQANGQLAINDLSLIDGSFQNEQVQTETN